MDTLVQDVRFAIRSLAKSPMFTTLSVLCLAVGIGLNANIYSAVYAAFLRPFPYADPDGIVVVQERNTRRGWTEVQSSFETFQDWQTQATSFERLSGMAFRSITITDGDEPVRLSGELVSWSLFPMLGVQPHIGRHFRPDEDQVGAPNAIMLGYRVWESRYGADSSIIGRVLPVNGAPHTVVGVMPKGFMFPESEEAWVPITPLLDGTPRGLRQLLVMGRLKPGTEMAAATNELAEISRRHAQLFPEAHGDWIAYASPLRERFIEENMKLVIAAMMGAVTFVLLIACANVANLLLARATSRGREIAVRTALGAGRGRIVRQLLTESMLLALIAVPLGIGIAYWLLDLVVASIPEGDMPYYIVFAIDGPVLTYTVLVGLATGVIFGLAPALQAARGDLVTSLKDGGRGASSGGTRQRMRSTLAVAEIALSMVLLVGAALFVKSFMNLQNKTGGVDVASVMTMRIFMPGQRYDSAFAINDRVDDVIRRVEALPGVVSATASNLIPLGNGGSGGQVEIEGKPLANRADAPFAEWTGVTSHWYAALGIPMVAGRTLTDAESREPSTVAVINETMAKRFWPGQDALGRRFKQVGDTSNTWFTVVGVSRDWTANELDDAAAMLPHYVVGYRRLATRNTAIMIRTAGAPAQITSSVRQALRESDPTVPVFDVKTLEEVRQFGFWAPRLFGWMFAMFGLVALLLASVGVYGVIAYGVSQRTQEFGVRMALGAQPVDVVRLVLRSGAMLAGLGIAIGLAGAFGVTRVIQSLLIDVSSTDAVSFIGVTVFLAAVALFASYVPARRATRVDPLTALRSE